jgi:hypothetical protein
MPVPPRFALLLSAALLATTPLHADPLSGQSDPAFAAALDQWLAADEATALPALAALAQEEKPAAQILLGLIDTTPALQGDWLMALPRTDRIALLRVPGGLSGQNWMQAAAAEPLAAAWLQYRDTAAPPTVILDFARLGEPRAARLAAITLAKREVVGFADIANDPAYPQSARAYAIREWQRADPARATQETTAITPGDPQGELLGLPRTDIANWLATNPEGDPLVALCQAQCPDTDLPSCLTASYTALGGYAPLMTLGSPIEAIIPSDRFNRSPMGLQTILYGIQGRDTGLACLNAAHE